MILTKKRILILITSVLLLTAFFALLPQLSLSTNAATEDKSGAIYEISEDGTFVIIIGYVDQIPSISIPAELDGLPVREIADSAFAGNASLYSVSLPDTVSVIGKSAFRNCRSLVSVTLPSYLTVLPYECFMGCTVLDRITLPETLTYIDDFCFEGCTKLGRVNVPASVTHIGYDAFIHCENIYLDVTANPYAAEYAALNHLNTEFEGTGAYFWLSIGLGTLIALAIAFVIGLIYLRYLRSHPEKDPNIFIFRVRGKIYSALSRAYHFAVKWLLFIISAVIYGIAAALRFISERLPKRKKRRSSPPRDDGSGSDPRLE